MQKQDRQMIDRYVFSRLLFFFFFFLLFSLFVQNDYVNFDRMIIKEFVV